MAFKYRDPQKVMKVRQIFLWLLLLCSVTASAQSLEERYRSFSKAAKQTYSDFRREANVRYANFLAQAWQYYGIDSAVHAPINQWIPPVLYESPIEPEVPTSMPCEYNESASTEVSRPQPMTPIVENNERTNPIVITFYGTQMSFRYPRFAPIKLTKVSEKQVARVWQELSEQGFDNLLFDCLQARDSFGLCDYAYGQMLRQLSEQILGPTNEAVLLNAFLYAQSGYAMRLANTKEGKLYLLIGSKYLIFDQKAFKFDDLYFYPMEEVPEGLLVCNHPFGNEQPMTLLISNDQQLASDSVKEITRKSRMGISTTVSINKNLIDFYDHYPTGNLGGDVGSRLAIYANAPLEQSVQQSLYQTLHEVIDGHTQREAANKILNYVQTAFTYEYDEKVWGRDRAFFPLESLYYPYNDCEDRCILFSRLIRDLLHADVVLLYYPGHLSTAVEFNENIEGDYVMVDEHKYIVCDPTFIGASIGKSMPQFKKMTAKIIKL